MKMKPNVKRRVRAQRKFAQGAYIPPIPTQVINTIPAKVDVTLTPPKEDRNIIHNNLSPRNLLDIVSFHSMHTHSVPIVLLERLAPTPTQNSRENSKPETQPSQPMCLRSRSRLSQRIRLKQKQKVTKPAIKAKRAKRASPCSTSDDETPLKFIRSRTKDLDVVLQKVPDVRVTRSATQDLAVSRSSSTDSGQWFKKVQVEGTTQAEINQERNGIEPAKQDNKLTSKAKSTPESVDWQIDNISTFKEPALPSRFTRATEQKKTTPQQNNQKHAVQNTLLPDSNIDSGRSDQHVQFYGDVGINRWLDWEISLVADEVMTPDRTLPDEGNSSLLDETPDRAVLDETKVPDRSPPSSPGTMRLYLSPSPAAKAPDRSPPSSPGTMRMLPSPSPSVCPSESLKTVRDVVTAPTSELQKRCKNCGFCQRVNTIQQISNLMQNGQRKVTTDDVYEFDGDTDEETRAPFSSHRKRRKSCAPVATSTPSQSVILDSDSPNLTIASSFPHADMATEDDEYHFYLDMSDSANVVRMTSVKMPNSEKRIMRAQLVPRGEATKTQDFSLTEHEELFDQLLNSLRVNSDAAQPAVTKAVDSPGTSNEPPNPSTANKATDSQAARKKKTKTSAPRPPSNKSPEPARNDKINKTLEMPSTSRGFTKARTNVTNDNSQVFLDNDTESNSSGVEGAKLVEAPVYNMTEEEFNDPISFFEKILPEAAKFGLCKVVAPKNFKPKCVLEDQFKFNVTNQYIGRVFHRWGPAAREMSSMKAYLASQNVTFSRVPLLESLEVNLPKFYLVVQRNGGLNEVIDKKKWPRVAEEMRFNMGINAEKSLDNYYVKYILPYEAATDAERQHIMGLVERYWHKKQRKLLDWALNPLHHQKKLLGESDSSEEETDDQSDYVMRALSEAEDCVVGGRAMNMSVFKRVANHANMMYLPHPNASAADIEKEYWRLVMFGTDHICVNSASIDTGASAYGFSKEDKTDPCAKHPWNLKMLSTNSGNVLRSLDSVLGVTAPTLHLGMVFSTSCWHRDPHGLPWMEYMHEGPAKIWYGIPDEQSSNFRQAVEALCPTSCQNKTIWLSSDITMIPPHLLRQHNVSLSHAIQRPGEFIIVFPKAYSCSISTGFTVSESVYFATNSWLHTVSRVYQELIESCEPTAFSLEQLLIALGEDPRVPPSALRPVYDSLSTMVDQEINMRSALVHYNIQKRTEQHSERRGPAWNVRELAECRICRKTLYLSQIVGLIARKTSLCLKHAVQLLKTPKYRSIDLSSVNLVTYFSDKQLMEIISKIQKRLA